MSIEQQAPGGGPATPQDAIGAATADVNLEAQRKITEQGQELAALRAELAKARGTSLEDQGIDEGANVDGDNNASDQRDVPGPDAASDTGEDQVGDPDGGEGEGEEEQSSNESEGTGEAVQTAQQAVERAGLDWETIQTEFTENAGLKQESYEALAKAGYGEQIVNAFLAGQAAIAEREMGASFDAAGGEEAYGKMIQWAGQNLPADEITAFNEALDKGADARLGAIKGLAARYQIATGNQPKPRRVGGKQPAAGATTKPFASMDDMAAAMRDPKYHTDANYRANVARRAAASTFN